MMDSLTIVLSGEAGQGLQTTEDLLVEAIGKSYHVFSVKDVMSRVRGGNNSVEIRISSKPIHAFAHGIDLFFLLNDQSYSRLENRVGQESIIFGETGFLDNEIIKSRDLNYIELNINKLAIEAGGAILSNTVLFGFIASLMDLEKASCKEQLVERFSNKSEKIIEGNLKAFDLGYQAGDAHPFPIKLTVRDLDKKYKIMDGSTAVGIGALAGGCDFVAAYPMSPSTGVLNYLAGKSKQERKP